MLTSFHIFTIHFLLHCWSRFASLWKNFFVISQWRYFMWHIMFFQFLIGSLFCQKNSRNLWRPGIRSFTMSQNCIWFFKEELEFPTSNGLELRESTMSWPSTFLDPVWKIYSIIVTGNSLWSQCWCLPIN